MTKHCKKIQFQYLCKGGEGGLRLGLLGEVLLGGLLAFGSGGVRGRLRLVSLISLVSLFSLLGLDTNDELLDEAVSSIPDKLGVPSSSDSF